MQRTIDRSNSKKKCQQTNERTSIWKVRSKRARSDYYIYMLIFIRMYKASIRTCTIQNYGKLQRTKPKLMLTILQRHETQRPHLHTYAMFRVLCGCLFLHFHLRSITSAVIPICSRSTGFFFIPFSGWCVFLVLHIRVLLIFVLSQKWKFLSSQKLHFSFLWLWNLGELCHNGTMDFFLGVFQMDSHWGQILSISNFSHSFNIWFHVLYIYTFSLRNVNIIFLKWRDRNKSSFIQQLQ